MMMKEKFRPFRSAQGEDVDHLVIVDGRVGGEGDQMAVDRVHQVDSRRRGLLAADPGAEPRRRAGGKKWIFQGRLFYIEGAMIVLPSPSTWVVADLTLATQHPDL